MLRYLARIATVGVSVTLHVTRTLLIRTDGKNEIYSHFILIKISPN
jgi:hypothetical protein